MLRKLVLIMTLVAVLAAVAIEAGANPFPSDEDLSSQGADRYRGLPAPGSVPIVFVPGLVSTDNAFEFSCTFSPDGREL